MNSINYQKELEKVLSRISTDNKPSLLLHACCAPCSSYVLEYLNTYFDITVFFYNPNIENEAEYRHRAYELIRFINERNFEDRIEYVIEVYNAEEFYQYIDGFEDCIEGGNRCFKCYELRLKKTAVYAKEKGFDYFTTTLSISPLKNANKLNEIGKALSKQYDIPYLFSDFKKNNGYKRSIELSKEFNLYRQNFCGCKFSRRDSTKNSVNLQHK